jgi:hypothetical protein
MEQATGQDTELAAKVRAFWDGLSPEEQARLDGVLRRLIDEGPDVSGHDWAEYSSQAGSPNIILSIIAILIG